MVLLGSPADWSGPAVSTCCHGPVHGFCGDDLPAIRVSSAEWIHLLSSTLRFLMEIGHWRLSRTGGNEIVGLEGVVKMHSFPGYMKPNTNVVALVAVRMP
jgi:hypothetical protein